MVRIDGRRQDKREFSGQRCTLRTSHDPGIGPALRRVNGRPLAVLDSIELTACEPLRQRRWRPGTCAKGFFDGHICGCGAQSAAQILALARVLPLREVLAFDLDLGRAAAFARDLSDHSFAVTVVDNLRTSLRRSDVVVTCTTSRRAFLMRDDVVPGTFIAAVGADNPRSRSLIRCSWLGARSLSTHSISAQRSATCITRSQPVL